MAEYLLILGAMRFMKENCLILIYMLKVKLISG